MRNLISQTSCHLPQPLPPPLKCSSTLPMRWLVSIMGVCWRRRDACWTHPKRPRRSDQCRPCSLALVYQVPVEQPAVRVTNSHCDDADLTCHFQLYKAIGNVRTYILLSFIRVLWLCDDVTLCHFFVALWAQQQIVTLQLQHTYVHVWQLTVYNSSAFGHSDSVMLCVCLVPLQRVTPGVLSLKVPKTPRCLQLRMFQW